VNRKKIVIDSYFKLIITSSIVALLSTLLAFSIKHLTEYFESNIFDFAKEHTNYLYIILPSIGIAIIYFLRKHLFKNKKNKGITEIYKTLDDRKEHLPFYKVPSHYLNGFLTVIFGGSTGVEVSTVVATAALGNKVYNREFSAHIYKRELICAGVAAGIAVLFTSPLTGWLFAMEVIARKISKTLVISCSVAAIIAGAFTYFFDNSTILSFEVGIWNWYALPFFLILSVLGGSLSVYFTFLVTRMKPLFSKFPNDFFRVAIGAVAVGLMIFFFPSLYGDSYEGLESVIQGSVSSTSIPIVILFVLAVLKPLAASITLGAGGDGGVFAPSIVAGSFLGLMFASVCNHFFEMDLILLNFALIGAAATLSASIYAPLTSLILVCNLLPNGYNLFLPMLVCCFVAMFFSKKLLPYNVYNHHVYLAKHGIKQ
jgi:chloride channel protein, CIC family